ncbi:hypothetical protein MNBD_IGNAVI01-450 [hydrothermal vent metagenome]|uniref:7-cyano-7-deazaguanine synthase n=1 Tax=hydrothermal vent metagenome TaxID=652676 RepID=A0A3B1CNC1_9ZZZZ
MEKIKSEKDNVNLFWTGGWDSTFQLLQLLLVYRRQVIPYYIIDPDRRSLGKEIQTMKNIKADLFKKFPFTKSLLKPTKYYAITDITLDKEIENAIVLIRKEKHIGEQYYWLASFCKEHNIHDMQLALEYHPTFDESHINIDPIITQSFDGYQNVFRIDPKISETEVYKVFRYFSFPIASITKLQMLEIANKKGWRAIMDITWFCHDPTCSNKPCGKCIPCRQVIKEGMGWRIPLYRRIISYFYTRSVLPVKIFLVKKRIINKIWK